MKWNFDQLQQQAQADAATVQNLQALEAYRIKYLGKKGLIQDIYASLPGLSREEKPAVGKLANNLRGKVTEILKEKKTEIESAQKRASQKIIDVSLPGVAATVGHKHLLTKTTEDICAIFEQLGFTIQDGPEIETEFNNFEALNIPADHPSRDGFDTFYLNQKDPVNRNLNLLLRSHTSPGQIRIMQEYKPPLAIVIPGKVFRPDAVDASHSFMFHQIEGLLVDEDIKFSDLKGLLNAFCKRFSGEDIKMRFRPHFFPFTEPSAEVDISWANGKKEWLEIMGCGMVNPHVFEACGYPKGKYTGLAFGMGVERIAMLKHGIKDIRTFFENDQRFLNQF